MCSSVSSTLSHCATWTVNAGKTVCSVAATGIEKVGEVAFNALNALANTLAPVLNKLLGWGGQAVSFLAAHPQATKFGVGLAILGIVGYAAHKACVHHHRAAVVEQRGIFGAVRDNNAAMSPVLVEEGVA